MEGVGRGGGRERRGQREEGVGRKRMLGAKGTTGTQLCPPQLSQQESKLTRLRRAVSVGVKQQMSQQLGHKVLSSVAKVSGEGGEREEGGGGGGRGEGGGRRRRREGRRRREEEEEGGEREKEEEEGGEREKEEEGRGRKEKKNFRAGSLTLSVQVKGATAMETSSLRQELQSLEEDVNELLRTVFSGDFEPSSPLTLTSPPPLITSTPPSLTCSSPLLTSNPPLLPLSPFPLPPSTSPPQEKQVWIKLGCVHFSQQYIEAHVLSTERASSSSSWSSPHLFHSSTR